MKWEWVPPPQHMDTRRRTIFAWVPRPCTDGYVRWLEWLVVTETFDCMGMDDEWKEIAARPVEPSAERSEAK